MTAFPTVTIRSISDVVTKGTTPTSLGRAFVSSGVRFIKVETIATDGKYLPDKVAYIDASTHGLLRRSQLKQDDILFSIAGALGRTAIVDSSWLPANTNQAFAIIRPSKRSGIDPRYLLWALRSQAIERHIAGINVQAAQANLSLEQVRDFEIPLPDIETQKVISDALDDADNLATTLKSLIAKKQAIKQGTVQQLLTGQTRLPGFDEPWRNVLLGDHVSYVKTVALSRAQLDTTSPLRYLHYGDIHTRSSVHIEADKEDMPRAARSIAGSAGRLQVGDVVFADASEDPDGVGKSVEISSVPLEGVVPGLHTIAARFDKAVLADGFKGYLQFIPAFRDSLLRLAAGTKVLATTRSYISSIRLSLPSVVEQRAIAEVLIDSDKEVDLLRTTLAKATSTRQGMMQELLTGHARLGSAEAKA
ncbi:restriction endonuclease subunit S [Arthrobacter sp. TS-15]|uniref:restriction endonuclease subunit S n=1 Tax=Arthrobacter sp. TS-15 TaxID=2510797 RepID=UPI00115F0142|nr:restriction endonuclease subunit S [Arthrobacter sp. TS-15]TQS88603.1 restriction endonuclease subunit S [Arthrobacter sp. TS-15]